MRNKTIPLFMLICVFVTGLWAEAEQTEGSAIQDTGGYVIYRDYTWKKEAYTGFLKYDETTYMAFINCPGEDILAEIYFTLEKSPEPGHLPEITGSHIEKGGDDVFSINYLIELFDCLRLARLDTDFSGFPHNIEKNFSFPLFGGNVVFSYSPLVTVFNLFSVKGETGKSVLELVESGYIYDEAAGVSLSGFTGAPKLKEKKSRIRKAGKADPVTVQTGAVEMVLDKDWQEVSIPGAKSGEKAFFYLEDKGFISFTLVNVPFFGTLENSEIELARRMVSSVYGSRYFLPSSLKIDINAEKRIKLDSYIYTRSEGKWVYSGHMLFPLGNGVFAKISMTVPLEYYLGNKTYFDNLFR